MQQLGLQGGPPLVADSETLASMRASVRFRGSRKTAGSVARVARRDRNGRSRSVTRQQVEVSHGVERPLTLFSTSAWS